MRPLHYRQGLIFNQMVGGEREVSLDALDPHHPPFRIQTDPESKHAFAIFGSEDFASYFDDVMPELFFGFEQHGEAFCIGRLH